MRDRLPSFDYYSPDMIDDVVELLTRLDGAVILQGGTDLLVAMKQKGTHPQHVVSLKRLRGLLGQIYENDGHIHIGASANFGQLERSALIKRELVVLHEAVQQIASYQIRNVATIGGNLCNASPAADTAPPLLVLGAVLRVQGSSGERDVPIEKFFTAPGKSVLGRGEVLKEIEVPKLKSHSGAAFVKLGRRVSEDISVASGACLIQLDGKVVREIRIALGSVAPTPLRAYRAENTIKGRTISEQSLNDTCKVAMTECSPISDVRASARYRRAMVGVLTRAAINTAASRASGGETVKCA
jgi:carbon-monoxide dehydrogenase medium subunit